MFTNRSLKHVQKFVVWKQKRFFRNPLFTGIVEEEEDDYETNPGKWVLRKMAERRKIQQAREDLKARLAEGEEIAYENPLNIFYKQPKERNKEELYELDHASQMAYQDYLIRRRSMERIERIVKGELEDPEELEKAEELEDYDLDVQKLYREVGFGGDSLEELERIEKVKTKLIQRFNGIKDK